jgi:hypothetical protein
MNRYYHRSINIPKLVESRFTPIPRNLTLARMIRLYKLPSATHLAGLREMEDKDIEEVADLFSRYSKRFDLAPIMTVEEVRYHFLSGQGTGEVTSGRRNGQVVWSYVVEVTNSFSGIGLLMYKLKLEPSLSQSYRLLCILFTSIHDYQTGFSCPGNGLYLLLRDNCCI